MADGAIDEKRTFHLSWILSALVALLVAYCSSGTSLEMVPLLVIIVAGLLLSIALIWLTAHHHRLLRFKVIGTILLCVLALAAGMWTWHRDRPILQPKFGVVLSTSLGGNGFALAVEGLVKNSGRQTGYADTFSLTLTIDGAESKGKELFAQTLPPQAVIEQQLFDQEFSPGKPVRGWLFFTFPGCPMI